MPQISKRKLHKNIATEINETFWEAISQLRSKSEIQSFLNDLLSPIERQMLSKRLAIACLLSRGYSYQSTQEIIKVSFPTIAKVSITLNNNLGYKTTINKIAKADTIKGSSHFVSIDSKKWAHGGAV